MIKRMYLKYIVVISLLLIGACTSPKMTAVPQSTSINFPPILQRALEAHGGLEKWQAANTLSYTIKRKDKPEHHFIELNNRKVLLKHEDYKIGFDGKEVWITPDLAAFGKGSPRFYHNLYFYFFAIPFVLTDPGINYEILPDREIHGQYYNALKVTFNEGVGDAPDDYYIALFNKTTNRMDWLLYTVTYFSGEKSEQFNALKYDWQEIEGLWLPSKLTGYKYEDGKVGEFRYSQQFDKVVISNAPPNQSIFDMPQEAVIAPLPTN